MTQHPKICPFCNVDIEEDPTHNGQRIHIFNYLLKKWNSLRTSLVKNRHGIEISISFEGNLLPQNAKKGKHYYQITPSALLKRGNTLDFKCTITNVRNDTMVFLINRNVLHPYSMFSLNDPNNNRFVEGKLFQLMPKSKYNVMVTFSQRSSILPGEYDIPICFSFQTIDKEVFHIARSIDISIEEEVSEEYEVYKSPFTGTSWEGRIEIHEPTCKIHNLNTYVIPFELRRILYYGLKEHSTMRDKDFRLLQEVQQKMNPGFVTENNFQYFWHHVLWLEEIAQEIGLQQYNMEEVELTLMENNQLELVVPGLVEKRPSVIVGDMIDIRLHNDLHTGYRGIIRKVNDLSVEIHNVHHELILIIESRGQMSEEYDVKFVLSRLGFERQHAGIDQIVKNKLLPCLFPPSTPRVRVRNILRTVDRYFDQSVATNLEQKTAVLNILNGTSGSYPYIVFGPPGTGKTVTVVEAILQLKEKTKHNILVCAPSNAACDMLTEKLLVYCEKTELLRIMSSSVDITAVHEIVIEYSNYKTEKQFQYVDSACLKRYRIIVSTLTLIGKYIGYYKPDVVFIDEAAQACEPEACIALGLIERGKQIVLAGDPKQLGPSTCSVIAEKYGLGKSLLERLMETDLYSGDNPNYKTMLIKNFRNHSTILYLPNKHFYGGLLEAHSQISEHDPISKEFVFQKIVAMRNKRNKGNKIDSQGQAIEFCNVISKESREGKSPSYYNKKELQMVIKYIEALQALKFDEESENVSPTDIGVVTPYVRQVHKLKGLLREKGLEEVEVGTTETFQGREKRIIIITTVRAQKDLLLYDMKYKLGFVKNKKRFNVAVTRAKSKLIIIGCAHVLATDHRWLSYIEECQILGGFCGAPFARRNDETIDDITRRVNPIAKDAQYKG